MSWLPRTVARLLLLSWLAACGGGSSGPSEAPVISNLRVVALTPLVPGRSAAIAFVVDYVDPQGDVFGGLCRFKRADGSIIVDIPISLAGPGVDTRATTGRVSCAVAGTYTATRVTVRLAVVDIRGHESNVLAVDTLLEEARPA
jgi:hypothetical protein